MAFVTSGTLAATATVCINAFDVRIPIELYALVFLGFGVMVAGFRAWDEQHAKACQERAKVLQLEQEARSARPTLRLDFDPKDPLCDSYDSGQETFRVQVWNDGDRRAENVRVVLHDVEPAAPKVLLQAFPDMKTGQDSFSVSPSQNRPPLYVNVLVQRPHNAFGHTQVLRLKGADWLPRDTKHLRLVLHLEADERTDLFELSFGADGQNKMRPVQVVKRGSTGGVHTYAIS